LFAVTGKYIATSMVKLQAAEHLQNKVFL